MSVVVDAAEIIGALNAVKGHVSPAETPALHRIQLRYKKGGRLFVSAGSLQSIAVVRVRVFEDESSTCAIDLKPIDVETLAKWLKPGKDEVRRLRIEDDGVHTRVTETGLLVDGRELTTPHWGCDDPVPDLAAKVSDFRALPQAREAVSLPSLAGLTATAASAAALKGALSLEHTENEGPIVTAIGESYLGVVAARKKTDDEDSGASRRRAVAAEWWLLNLPAPEPKPATVVSVDSLPDAEDLRVLLAEVADLGIRQGWLARRSIVRGWRLNAASVDKVLHELDDLGVIAKSEDPGIWDVLASLEFRQAVVDAIRRGVVPTFEMAGAVESDTLDLGDAATPAPAADVVQDVARAVITKQFCSLTMLIRHLAGDAALAAVVMEELERHAVVGADTGARTRDVLVAPEGLEEAVARIAETESAES